YGARVFISQHVQIAVRPLTHVANALMKLRQNRFSLDGLTLLVERDATDVTGATRSSLNHRADERIALPLREPIASVERDAGGRQRWNEVDERRLEVRTRGGVADRGAVVVPSESHERPPVVAPGFDDVDLVAAERPVLGFPDRTGRGMQGQPLRAAVTE